MWEQIQRWFGVSIDRLARQEWQDMILIQIVIATCTYWRGGAGRDEHEKYKDLSFQQRQPPAAAIGSSVRRHDELPARYR